MTVFPPSTQLVTQHNTSIYGSCLEFSAESTTQSGLRGCAHPGWEEGAAWALSAACGWDTLSCGLEPGGEAQVDGVTFSQGGPSASQECCPVLRVKGLLNFAFWCECGG